MDISFMKTIQLSLLLMMKMTAHLIAFTTGTPVARPKSPDRSE
jgi:hypothetical protein